MGAALIVAGLVLLALIDAPRRLLWRIRRFRGLPQPPPSGPQPADGVTPHEPGTWLSPPPGPASRAEVTGGGRGGAVWQERPPREVAGVDGATTPDPGGTPGSDRGPGEPGLDPSPPSVRPSEQVD